MAVIIVSIRSEVKGGGIVSKPFHSSSYPDGLQRRFRTEARRGFKIALQAAFADVAGSCQFLNREIETLRCVCCFNKRCNDVYIFEARLVFFNKRLVITENDSYSFIEISSFPHLLNN